jgi:hypothetical protein
MVSADVGGLRLSGSFFNSSFGIADVLSSLTEGNDTPVLACRAQIYRSADAPMLKQGFDMLIDRVGDYETNSHESAHGSDYVEQIASATSCSLWRQDGS